jgi:hypothetical protein
MAKRKVPSALTSKVVGIALLCTAAIATAANLNFLRDTPLMHFRQSDYDLMLKNAAAVLDSAAPNASQSWNNPKTGASGLAEVKAQFTAKDGASCRRLRIANTAARIEGEATYTVCKYPERGWTLNPDAAPPQ